MSKAGSPPHSEDRIRCTEGVHSLGCIAVYSDVVDYSPEADFYHGARYDLAGNDVSTASIIIAPMKQKNTPAIQQAVASRLGPNEEFAWTGSDGAQDIDNALEAYGGNHFSSRLIRRMLIRLNASWKFLHLLHKSLKPCKRTLEAFQMSSVFVFDVL